MKAKNTTGDCPTCNKPLTLGVMYRVDQLADRPLFPQDVVSKLSTTPPQALPPRAAPFRSLVPLEEILAEIESKGPKTKTVQRRYEDLISRLGSELFILEHAPLEDIQREGSSLVAEAISRMRTGRVIRQSGYDGEYGRIRFFDPEEIVNRSCVSLHVN